MIERLLPIALASGISYKGYENKDVITDKLKGFVTSIESVVNSQRIGMVAHALELAMIDENPPKIEDPKIFKETVRKLVKIGKKNIGDPAKDYWGTELRMRLEKNTIIIYSAGPDQKFGTKDDQHAITEFVR
ncbi:MAG: hypothetical protein RIQ81_2615 [Pseudomonadota bacterium]|jgi:hypothetical protein